MKNIQEQSIKEQNFQICSKLETTLQSFVAHVFFGSVKVLTLQIIGKVNFYRVHALTVESWLTLLKIDHFHYLTFDR
jgi:hypothetical protein